MAEQPSRDPYHPQHNSSVDRPSHTETHPPPPSPLRSAPLPDSAPWTKPYDVSPAMSRSPSVAGSDRFSSVSGITGSWPQNPLNVHPAAAYVAQLGAAQVVSEYRGAHKGAIGSDDEDSNADRDDVQFSEQALSLINSFLDNLLYSVLASARSTNLHTLRPAVTDVLKSRLAKQAIASADEELQELLAGGEEEEDDDDNNKLLPTPRDDPRKWDLELVWKRTRLRVMVYMRLGEMEDDDEENYVKEQELFSGRELDSRRRFSANSGLVSWSAAIFLTSVLEYVAEQTLQISGSAAYARARRQSRTAPLEGAVQAQLDSVVVEEYDVERVALDPRIGRLWRTWRKTLRNQDTRPETPTQRGGVMGSRRNSAPLGSQAERADGGESDEEDEENGVPALPGGFSTVDVPEMEHPEHVIASNIPLPMGDAKRDVDEIEVPGLARDPDEVEDGEEQSSTENPAARRRSFHPALLGAANRLPTPADSPASQSSFSRQRSMSVPTPTRAAFLEMPVVVPTPEPTSHHEMPGAFPTDDEDDDAVAGAADTEKAAESEPAANTLESVHPEEAEAEPLADTDKPDKSVGAEEGEAESFADANQSADQAKKIEVPMLGVAAVAGTTAVAGIATVGAVGQNHGLEVAAAAGVTALAGVAAVGVIGQRGEKSGAQKSGAQKSVAEKSADALSGPRETKSADTALAHPRQRTPQEIERLDRGKSPMDMKTLIGVSGEDGLENGRFDQDGLEKGGFDMGDLEKDGLEKDGLEKNGLDEDGLEKGGFDMGGSEEYDFAKDGLQKDSIVKSAFGKTGLAKNGLEKEGLATEAPVEQVKVPVAKAQQEEYDPYRKLSDTSTNKSFTLGAPAQGKAAILKKPSWTQQTIVREAHDEKSLALEQVDSSIAGGGLTRELSPITPVTGSTTATMLPHYTTSPRESPESTTPTGLEQHDRTPDGTKAIQAAPPVPSRSGTTTPEHTLESSDATTPQHAYGTAGTATSRDERNSMPSRSRRNSLERRSTLDADRTRAYQVPGSSTPQAAAADQRDGLPSRSSQASFASKFAMDEGRVKGVSVATGAAAAAYGASALQTSGMSALHAADNALGGNPAADNAHARVFDTSTAGKETKSTAAAPSQRSPTPPPVSPLLPTKSILHHGSPKIQQTALPPRSGPQGTSTPPVVTSASIRGPEDFDAFIQSEATLKYTLTPETARELPGENATQSHAELRPTTKARSQGSMDKKRTPILVGVTAPAAMSPPVQQAPIIQPGSVADAAQILSQPRQDESKSDSRSVTNKQSYSTIGDHPAERQLTLEEKASRRRSFAKPPLRNTSAHRASGLIAREPTVLTESTRDFADFIRSTGPGKESTLYALNTANRSTTSLRSATGSTREPRSMSIISTEGERDGDRAKSLTQREMFSKNIPPVPAVPGKGSGKVPSGTGYAREARGYAQGGNTAEIIQFLREGPQAEGTHRIERSVAPFRTTMDSEVLRDDFRGVNGQRLGIATDGGSSRGRLATPKTNGGMVEKTRYRNKDPYALDFSDEDEDDADDLLTALPVGRSRQEESLADFLQNSAPPQGNAPKPVLSSSAPNHRMSSLPSTTSKIQTPHATVISSSAVPGGPRRRLEAREPVQANKRATRDLAEFLRTSEPPPGSAPGPVIGRQGGRGAEGNLVVVEGGGRSVKKKKGFWAKLRGR